MGVLSFFLFLDGGGGERSEWVARTCVGAGARVRDVVVFLKKIIFNFFILHLHLHLHLHPYARA